MDSESIPAFCGVSRCLASHDYWRLQYFPGHRQRVGAELEILRACVLKSRTVLLRGSGVYPAYRAALRCARPTLDKLAALFFECRQVPAGKVSTLFQPAQLGQMTAQRILSATDTGFVSNFRFVPIDRLLIACSPVREYDTEDYVYLGSDTVMFRDLIASRLAPRVDHALEIGCGTGFLALWLAQRSSRVTAVDISERALGVTRVNAAMNDIDNVTALESDVYSAVPGRFDVIVSNPPYMFLPEDKKTRTHAYGGHFGTDITRRILLGLDAHLTPEGTAFVFSDSYIQDDGTDTLCEVLVELLHEQPWQVTATQVDYQPVRGALEFYRRHRVTHSIRYFVTIRRAPAFAFAREKLSGVARTIQNLKLRFAENRR